jgi:Cu-Zn family superoxide dismutase
MAVAVVALSATALVVTASPSSATWVVARTTLIDNAGANVGVAYFTSNKAGDVVGHLQVRLPADSSTFHGMHIHANTDGTGCVPGTGFTGVGGHWDVGGHTHGAHTGDLPSLIRKADGAAWLVFDVDSFTAADLVGKALIVHAGPDNFGNVPLGTAANQYSDNGSAYYGTGGTALTGNAGTRFACGVIRTR